MIQPEDVAEAALLPFRSVAAAVMHALKKLFRSADFIDGKLTSKGGVSAKGLSLGNSGSAGVPPPRVAHAWGGKQS